jgi:hypothetical protein
MTKEQANGTCFGVEFYVDERWRFHVPDLAKSYESYEQMKAAIEGQAKRIEATKKTKLALAVVNEDGEPTTVVGVHAGHGRGLVKPKIEIGHGGAFPDVPWIRSAIARGKDLQSQADDIHRVLNRFRLGIDDYSNKYSSCPTELQRLYDKLMAAANASSLQQELGKKSRKDDE